MQDGLDLETPDKFKMAKTQFQYYYIQVKLVYNTNISMLSNGLPESGTK